MEITQGLGRTGGRAAYAAAVAGTVLAPIHALSRYATPEGQEDVASPLVSWWAEPAADRLSPLLTWSDPYTVYSTYGKGWLFVLAASTLGAFVVRGRREPTGLERWGWRIALTGYVLATLSVAGDYFSPWMDASFAYVGIPGMLISVVGSCVLGIALLRRRYQPRASGWLLATWPLTLFALASVIALGAALLPMVWAWGLAGLALSKPAPQRVPA